jgi:hypothetical protein
MRDLITFLALHIEIFAKSVNNLATYPTKRWDKNYIMVGFTPFPEYRQVRVKGMTEFGEGRSVGKVCQRPEGWGEA